MITLERLLCPVPLPPESHEALRRSVSLSRAFKAKLFVCHCAKAPMLPFVLNRAASDGRLKRVLTEWLKRQMGRFDASQPGWKAIVVENARDCGEEIVRIAREQRIDLIVMHSRRSRAALLGSTTEQVSRTASCPVLIVHPQEGERETNKGLRSEVSDLKSETSEDLKSETSEDLKSEIGDLRSGGFERVLVSHDFSSSSELSLSYAISIAEKFKSELHLMHVLAEPDEDEREIALTPVGVETVSQRALRRLQVSVPHEVYQNCTVTHVVRWGKPYREVLAYARQQNIDLVCMGALGSDFGLEALFGSNVDRVLRQAMCSVLIARPLKSAVLSIDLRIMKASTRRSFSRGV